MLNVDYIATHNATKNVAASQKIIVSFMPLLIVTLFRDNLLSVWTLLFMSSVIIFYAQIHWKVYVKLIIAPIGFLVASLIAIVLSITFTQAVPDTAMWHSSVQSVHFYILASDVSRAIRIFFTALSATSCLYFLILTTPIYEISPVLTKLNVPTIIIELIELMYRFIFIFLQTMLQLYTAQQARLGYSTYFRSFHSLSLLISALFRSVFFRYEAMSYAMAARNIEQFLMPEQFLEIKTWDVKLTTLIIMFSAISIVTLTI